MVIHESFIYGIVYLCGYISTSIGKTIIKCICDDCLICVIYSLHVNDLGKVCVVEIILFIMSHIFNVNFERQEAISFHLLPFPSRPSSRSNKNNHRQLSD